jgi:hypothetical protein
MHFGASPVLFERYVRTMARYRCRSESEVLAEVEGFLEAVGRRHRTRYMLLPEELLLFFLPVLAQLAENGDRVALLLGRGMEPYLDAGTILCGELGLDDVGERLMYVPLFRRRGPGSSLLAQSILAALEPHERRRPVAPAAWALARELAGADLPGRRATTAEVVSAVADIALDPRLARLYTRARELSLTEYLDLEKLDGIELSVPAAIKAIVTPLEACATFEPGDATSIVRATKTLANGDASIRSDDRDLLLHYGRLHLFAEDAGRLRNALEHGARPILNALLAGTSLHERLSRRRVVCVDETVNSGTALLLAELLVRSFADNLRAPVSTHVIASVTPALDDLVREARLVDSTSCDVLWSQEDLNELYAGFFRPGDDGVHASISYSDAATMLEQRSPQAGRRSVERLEALDAGFDEIAQGCDALAFVDRFGNWRHPSNTVKRELVKLVVRSRSEDDLVRDVQRLVAFDATKTFLTYGDELCVDLLVRDRIRELHRALEDLSVPPRLAELERRLGGADQARHLRRWANAYRTRREEMHRQARRFAAGPLGAAAASYLAGAASFADVRAVFYGESPQFETRRPAPWRHPASV